jgi:hypothetical protein
VETRRIAGALACCAALTLVAGTASSVMAEPRTSEPSAAVQDAQAAWLANGVDVSEEQAAAALKAGDELRPVIGQIRRAVGPREVELAIEYFPTTRLRLVISGTEPVAGLDALVASSPHPIDVSHVQAPGIKQLGDEVAQMADVWREHFAHMTRATVDDSDPTHVLVFHAPGERLTESDLRRTYPDFPAGVRLSVFEEVADQNGWSDLGGK